MNLTVKNSSGAILKNGDVVMGMALDQGGHLTHGHKYNIGNVPPNFGDMLIYGHLHQGFIIKEDGKIFANPGSISCPRNGSEHSYLILTEEKITLKDIDGNIVKTVAL
mgnify:CR=1 FL=1